MLKLPTLIVLTIAIIVGGYFLIRGNKADNQLQVNDLQDNKGSVAVPFEEKDVIKAVIKTSKGDIEVDLYRKNAPQTVKNFATLAVNKFYDGTTFHRVVADFVVQGGDPLSKTLPVGDPKIGTGGPGFTFADEINLKSLGAPDEYIKQLEAKGYKYIDTVQSLLMDTGVLAMANSGPDTNGSQFFIVLNESNVQHLNGLHTVFGRVTKGMEIVNSMKAGDKINSVEIIQ